VVEQDIAIEKLLWLRSPRQQPKSSRIVCDPGWPKPDGLWRMHRKHRQQCARLAGKSQYKPELAKQRWLWRCWISIRQGFFTIHGFCQRVLRETCAGKRAII